MNSQELKSLIENSDNKFEILTDTENLLQYNIKISDLLDLAKEYLNDTEKVKLLELEKFKTLPVYAKESIVKFIIDDEIKIKLLQNKKVISGFNNYQIVDIIKSLSESGKVQILQKPDFFKENDIKPYSISNILNSLNEENKKKLVANKKNMEKLNFNRYDIEKIVAGFESEKTKINMIEVYDFNKNEIANVLKSFSEEEKKKFILENKYKLNAQNIESVISTLNTDSLTDFIKNNKEFLKTNNIKPYKIIRKLDVKKQIDFVQSMDKTGLSSAEKKRILVTLNEKTKQQMDMYDMQKEYVEAIKMQIGNDIRDTTTYGKVIVDLDQNLEKYKYLDELIAINPMEVPKEKKERLFQLCELCPKIKVNDSIGLSPSTAMEYRNAEMWIDSILHGINPKWTDIQKIAFIDNAIGKKISYSPDFNTEKFNAKKARVLWKIIDSGYGVCNGIAQVEKYILDKIGIESEMVSGKNHVFLKLKNIELPNEDNKMITGETILDPTWNLMTQRYGAKPENFCKSYEEIRKHDIRSDGIDFCCHKNDEELSSATLNLNDKELRKIFASIGLADRNGNFPIKDLIEKAKKIDAENLPTEESIKRQFSLLKEYCPEFATCQNSTTRILEEILLNQKNLRFNKCVVNRVYEKKDKDKEPILYVYTELPETGKKFYYANKESGNFVELPEEEFEAKFECYEMDMKKNKGLRDWEDKEKNENINSEKVIVQEGDER